MNKFLAEAIRFVRRKSKDESGEYMRKMIDSGVDWIGEMPSTWRISKIKYCSVFSPKCNFYGIKKDSLITYTPMEYIKQGFFIQNTKEYGELPKSLTPYQEGDIVFAKVTPCFENGNIAIMEDLCSGYGLGSSELFVIRATDVETKFLFYWLQSNNFIQKAASTMTGMGGLKRVSGYFVSNAPILLPTSKEQKQISRYLDIKCFEISCLIREIQKQIEALEEYKSSIVTNTVTKGINPNVEMKDSGVQWIGLMPQHWNCYRGKFVLKHIQRPVSVNDEVITCFRDGEVTLRSNRREDGFTISDKEIGYQGIDIGDLVVHGMDGFAGAIGISDSRGKASPVLNVLDTEQNKRYIMYYLRSMAYSNVFLALATGIRVRSCDIRWNKLAELRYPVPPLNEQKEIVDYIDNTLLKTNEMITMKRKQICMIEEFKKSLIFEYVTGKKEVPNE